MAHSLPLLRARSLSRTLLVLSLVLSLGRRGLQAQTMPATRTTDWNTITALLPPVQQAYLKAPTVDASDHFGQHVVLDGDTLVVSLPGDASAATGVGGDPTDNTAAGAGAVHVFVRTGTTWTPQAYLKASNAEAGDGFGTSLALAGDTLVVGAINEDSGAAGVNGDQADNSVSHAGAAYVFVRTGTTWTQQAYLKAATPMQDHYFGAQVVLEDTTIVIGSLGRGAPSTVTVFARQPTPGQAPWTLESTLADPTGAAGTNFGWDLALAGDTLVVSAPSASLPATTTVAGAVYIFGRQGATWTVTAVLTAAHPGHFDLFGRQVALDNGTLVISAVYEDSAATGIDGDAADNRAPDSGAVYVFVQTGTTWTQQAYLKASNTETRDAFGWKVALAGDTLVVSAVYEDSAAVGINGDQQNAGARDAGAVYMFSRTGTIWRQQAYGKASNTNAEDHFGGALHLSATTLVVGAFDEDSAATGIGGDQADNSASGAGAVYLVDLTATPPPLTLHGYLPLIGHD